MASPISIASADHILLVGSLCYAESILLVHIADCALCVVASSGCTFGVGGNKAVLRGPVLRFTSTKKTHGVGHIARHYVFGPSKSSGS